VTLDEVGGPAGRLQKSRLYCGAFVCVGRVPVTNMGLQDQFPEVL